MDRHFRRVQYFLFFRESLFFLQHYTHVMYTAQKVEELLEKLRGVSLMPILVRDKNPRPLPWKKREEMYDHGLLTRLLIDEFM